MRYIVNEQQGVVVAIMDSVHNKLLKTIKKACPFLTYSARYSLVKRFPDTYKGIARCSPLDEWFEPKGKSIAEAKAELSYVSAEQRVLLQLHQILTEARGEVMTRVWHLDDVAESLLNDAYPG